MKTNVTITITAVVIIVSFVLTFNHDYRWVGHVVASLTMLSFICWCTIYGLILAKRIKRPPKSGLFGLHRKLAIIFSATAILTFVYGLLIMLPQGKNLLSTPHGWLGLIIAMISVAQIVPSLVIKSRTSLKSLHRWTGYLLAGLVVAQTVIGITVLPMFVQSPPTSRFSVPWQGDTREIWRADGVISSNEYYTLRTTDNGNFEIHYKNDGDHYHVGLRAKTTGWVAIGVSRGEGMQNAGIVYGYVSEGKATVIDSFGINRYKHKPDVELGGTNDIIEFGGSEDNAWTTIEFHMPVSTGDKYDIPILPGEYQIIWAYGTTDSPEMHATQGYLDVMLEPR